MFRYILALIVSLCSFITIAQDNCPTPGPAPDCSKVTAKVTCNKYPERYWKDLGEQIVGSLVTDPGKLGNSFSGGEGGTCCEKRLFRGFFTITEYGDASVDARTIELKVKKSFLKREWFEKPQPPQCFIKSLTKELPGGGRICVRFSTGIFGAQWRLEDCSDPTYGAGGNIRFQDTCEVTIQSGDLKKDLCCADPITISACKATDY